MFRHLLHGGGPEMVLLLIQTRIVVFVYVKYSFLLVKEYPISTASSFGSIGVGLWTKNKNPTSRILLHILPRELLSLRLPPPHLLS